MPREVEVKSVVDDVGVRRRRVEAAGGTLMFAGRLEDRRYDTVERSLTSRDHVLRLRTFRDAAGARATLDWKGPTAYEDGYKLREELTTDASDGDAVAAILERLGFRVTREIDREIAMYALGEAIVRFERYPRMDVLVEVEGPPAAIERAIDVLGLPRDGFTTDRLDAFVTRYQARTGERAAIADSELASGTFLRPSDV